MKRHHCAALLRCGIILALAFCSEVWGQCGVERWSVKTGTDSGGSTIDLTSSTPTTISNLISVSAPHPIPVDTRISPTETTSWTINATLIGYKVENDSDYHLVISDDAGSTMIVEIPSPNCVGSSSPFASAIAQARSKFDAVFTASSSLQHVNVPVQVKGIAMFDFLHGQTGVAPNGIELHPVLDIIFNPPTQPGSNVSLSAAPASLGLVAGSSANTTVSTAVTGSFSSDVSLSTSGLPSGLSTVFNPATIASPGSGSSTLTVAADPALLAGNYNFVVVGSGGSSTAQSSIAVNVCGTTVQPPLAISRAAGVELTPRDRLRIGSSAATRDEDDGQIQIVPSETTRARSGHHGGDPLCAPRQYDVFLGSDWKASDQAREASLSHVTARLLSSAVCKASAAFQSPLIRERTDNVDSDVSDLKVQALLVSMLNSHQLQPPNVNAVYVLFLGKDVQSKIGEQQGGREFLAYHNHFHASQGVVRYVVVPFDTDLAREKRTTAQGILAMLVNPDGPAR
jgi:hypothetical protein